MSKQKHRLCYLCDDTATHFVRGHFRVCEPHHDQYELAEAEQPISPEMLHRETDPIGVTPTTCGCGTVYYATSQAPACPECGQMIFFFESQT